MAALNFPSNPVNGQVYGAYTYDASVSPGFWRSAAASNASTYTSLTAPSSTTSGDLWWKTDTGESFVNYYDGSSYQWVQTQSPVTGAGYVSPNYIINGAMEIAQRGTSFAGTAWSYPADRFTTVRNNYDAGMTASRQTSGLAGIQYCVRIQRNSGNTLTSILFMRYGMETVQSTALQGKTATVSFYARKGADLTAAPNFLLYTGTGVDQPTGAVDSYTGSITQVNASPSLTTSWVRYSYTFTMPSNATQIGFEFKYTPTGTAGTNDYYEVTGVQLEEGAVATTFRRNANSIQGELDACQRYYFRLSTLGTTSIMGAGSAASANDVYILLKPPTVMRAKAASIDYSSLSHFSLFAAAQGTLNGITAFTLDGWSTPETVTLVASKTSSVVGDRPYLFFTNAANSYIGFSAEL